VDAGELRIADPVVNLGPGFPVAELSTGGELKVGTVLAGAEPGSFSFPVDASNSLPDVGVAPLVSSPRSEKKRIVRRTRNPRSLVICHVRASSRFILLLRLRSRFRSVVAKCRVTMWLLCVGNRGSWLYGRASRI
jgi:hypothetical protein